MAKYRILSMDGGGIRGVLTARLLSHINVERPAFLGAVELFAGTSTGAILAVALAKGLPPDQIIDLYTNQGPSIFHKDILHDLGSLWGLHGARYTTANRYDGIKPTFGESTLDDLLPKHVIVASFQLDPANPINPVPPEQPQTWRAKFFHNYPGSDSDGAEKAIDVIMRSSAAPTYFPIYQGFVDGGVVANNPSVCAVAQAINTTTGGKQDIKDVVLMSLGTGGKNMSIGSRDGDWGIQEWGFNLVDLLFESGIGLADYQCQQLLGPCYKRLDPILPGSVGLDAVDQIGFLIDRADKYFAANQNDILQWIDRQW